MKRISGSSSKSVSNDTTNAISSNQSTSAGSRSVNQSRPISVASFFKWFKKAEKPRHHNNVTLRRSKKNESSETISSLSSLNLSNRSSRHSTSSCDSILSTETTGFAFISAQNYRPAQSKKLLDPGPITETYRNRLKKQDESREHDRILELTLRRKYKLYHENEVRHNITAKNIITTYSEYSLPNPKHYEEASESGDENLIKNRTRHRRAASDSTKDIVPGHVHIKGKRKAPPPPLVLPNSPVEPKQTATLGRNKKRKAPPPPRIKSMIEDDQTMTAIIKYNSKMENDTLKLENGMLKSMREYKPIPTNASPPISPRPWFKRTSIVKESTSNQFKKDIVLNPIDKILKGRKENDFPEVGYSRNSLVDHNNDIMTRSFEGSPKSSKRVSGISIPNISELDRQATEIVEKEKAIERARIKQENEKYFAPPETITPKPDEEVLVNKTIDGLWVCPYCTLENPNWKIVCEACEKLKPYDLRFEVRKPFFSSHNTPQKIPLNTLKSSSDPVIDKEKLPEEKSGLVDAKDVVITTMVTLVEPPTVVVVQKQEKTKTPANSSPDLDLVRKARITHFETHDPPKPKSEHLNTREKLEREKERLRRKIEEMNAKALTQKYPPVPSAPVLSPSEPPVIVGAVRKMCPRNPEIEKPKLGAIKKLYPKKETPEEEGEPDVEFDHIYENLTPQQTVKVEEMTTQLQSQEGVDEFRKTMKNTRNTMTNQNTLAINKILRNLETAIADGDFELAANYARKLARMKVSLSVTRQSSLDMEKIDVSDKDFEVDLFISEKNTRKGPMKTTIKPSMKLIELKTMISNDHKIPSDRQSWILNDHIANDDDSTLMKYGITSERDTIVLNVINAEDDEGSDSGNENAEYETEGAVALPKRIWVEEDEGEEWACPLCTLINMPDQPDCGACSQQRPLQNEPKNDLNKHQSPTRKSAEILNIKPEDNRPTKIPLATLAEPQSGNFINRPSNTSIVMTVLNNPNITRTKYLVDPITFTPFQQLLQPIPINPIIKPLQEKPKTIKLRSPKRIKAPEPPPPKTIPITLNHYDELLNLDGNDIVSNTDPFECQICYMRIESGDGVTLRDCLHVFCKGCLFQTIEHSEDIEIKCPYMDNNYSCECFIRDREMKALVTAEIYEKHLAKSLRQAEHVIENAFHCKTPNCRGWCIFEDDVNVFKCPVCCITNCLTCQVIHDGLDCKQYQDRLNSGCDSNVDALRTKEMLKEMVDKGEAMNCPVCQVILMKKWGCDWLKCSMCKTEVCWVTRGPRWGPGGKGDTTGGCKCGINGKKCHEKCNYCH